MESSTRLGIDIEIKWGAIRGVTPKELEVYGPFDTLEEAQIFCGKRFPDDTVDYFEMKKEIVTHGEEA
jgi:hypothetical protein|tara:strand:- start:170 stop:373 length:204 start_codon:yes stop_codon:yes gene_type:complete